MIACFVLKGVEFIYCSEPGADSLLLRTIRRKKSLTLCADRSMTDEPDMIT